MCKDIYPNYKNIATCIGCGCDDYHACYDPNTGQGCSWVKVDRESGLGVCSVCLEHVERWDNGDRTISQRETNNEPC